MTPAYAEFSNGVEIMSTPMPKEAAPVFSDFAGYSLYTPMMPNMKRMADGKSGADPKRRVPYKHVTHTAGLPADLVSHAREDEEMDSSDSADTEPIDAYIATVTNEEIFDMLVNSVATANKKAQQAMDRAVEGQPIQKHDKTFLLQYVIGTLCLHWNHPVHIVRGFTLRDFINRRSTQGSTVPGQSLMSMYVAPDDARCGTISILLTPFQCQVFDFYMR